MDTRSPVRHNHQDDNDVLNQHVHDPGDPDGIIAAEKERMWRQGKNASERQSPQYQPKRRWPMVLAMFVTVAVLVTGAYFLGFQNANEPIVEQKQIAKEKSERKVSAATTATKRYTSNIFALSFDYPENWVISDTAARLTVTSPELPMSDEDDGESGHVLVTIQHQQTNLPGYPVDGAIATLDSQKLTYKKPSAYQRTETQLSFVDYDGLGGITKMFLTGSRIYQAGQTVPLDGVTAGNPLISVGFQKCSKSYCAGGTVTPISIQSGSWKNAVFKPQIIKLLESLTFE